MASQNPKQSKPETIGVWLMLLGIVGFIFSVIINFIPALSVMDKGSTVAISFLFMMLGVSFYFPSMLEDPSGGLSTMRVIVFAVVMVFVIIYIKLGWNASEFEEFKIDRTWVYILGLAFGSKAFQKFAEEKDDDTTPPKP